MLLPLTQKIIDAALLEDIGKGDITTHALTSPQQVSEAHIIAREDGIICGLNIAQAVFKRLDPRLVFKSRFREGQKFGSSVIIAHLRGKTRCLLTAERVALNFLSYLSGISTQTNLFVEEVKLFKTKIFDTRKTTPGLRILEKQAVLLGGGHNHRSCLDEMYLVKDNHRMLYGEEWLTPLKKIRKTSKLKMEVEVDTIEQFKSVLTINPDIIMLDNMSIAQMKKAVEIKRQNKIKTLLEASGGITLKDVRKVAQTGVDRISIGALTHHRIPIDFSLEILPS